MSQRQVIETGPDGLRFEFDWLAPDDPSFGPTYGSLTVLLGRQSIWPASTSGERIDGITALWIELLEHLSNYWRYLMLEQGYPFNVNPLQPAKLDDELAKRWENMSEERQDQEEEEVYAFKLSHNLAQASAGAKRPDLWFVRDGGMFVVEAHPGGQPIVEHIPATEIKRVLTAVGNAIALRLNSSSDSRSSDVAAAWNTRDNIDLATQARIATGLPVEYLTDTCGTDSFEDVFTDPESSWAGDNALIDVAYRFKGQIRPDRLRTLLKQVRTASGSISSELGSMSGEAGSKLAIIETNLFPPHRQGTALAAWLRECLNIGTARVEPEELLNDWGVTVSRFDFSCDAVDAMAHWAHNCRPSVLWNCHEKHSSNEGARRATLSHEICHLLVDRTALPMAAVVGGAMERRLEQRANAFAAEFLCPKSEARKLFDFDTDVARTIQELTHRFGVSNELAALQLARSRYHGDPDIQREIESFGPQNARYPWS